MWLFLEYCFSKERGLNLALSSPKSQVKKIIERKKKNSDANNELQAPQVIYYLDIRANCQKNKG